MRAFVCGQCHVEYYFKGEGKVVTYPWANGLKVEEIEAYYDKEGFTDWVHAETGTKMLKAQHPEFEVWNQGIHARAGVACADCHMPYERVGALKVSDHWVRSPLLNINRACQPCHAVPEKELESRVLTIQDRFIADAAHQLKTPVAALRGVRGSSVICRSMVWPHAAASTGELTVHRAAASAKIPDPPVAPDSASAARMIAAAVQLLCSFGK